MKKKLLILTVVAAALVSCSKTVLNDGDAEGMKRVKFMVSNDEWSVATRSLEADGQEMTDLWLFDYVDGELVATVHKIQGDADFDIPSLEMKFGEHHVYFVASRGKNPTMSGTTITWETPSDTFWKDVEVSVSDGSAGSVSVTLDRVVTKLRVAVNDAVPEGTASVGITPQTWWYGLDYMTGAATQSQQTERSIAVPASYVGTSGQLMVSVFGLSDDDEWMTDVTIKAKNDAGDVIGQVTLDDVPFLRNRVTEASGNLFGSSTSFSITMNTEWLEPYVLEW
jgi:hypothetical protein